MSKTKYEPLEDRVLIRTLKEKDLKVTTGGIIDPNVKQRAVSKGEVVAAGPGFTARDTGLFVQTSLVKGDIVLYGSGAGLEIEIEKEDGTGEETVLIMREGDCFLLISKKAELI